MQAHREIKARCGAAQLSITDIFRFPVLNALVGRLEELTGGVRPADSPAAAPAEEVASRADARAEAISKRRAMRARRRTGAQ